MHTEVVVDAAVGPSRPRVGAVLSGGVSSRMRMALPAVVAVCALTLPQAGVVAAGRGHATSAHGAGAAHRSAQAAAHAHAGVAASAVVLSPRIAVAGSPTTPAAGSSAPPGTDVTGMTPGHPAHPARTTTGAPVILHTHVTAVGPHRSGAGTGGNAAPGAAPAGATTSPVGSAAPPADVLLVPPAALPAPARFAPAAAVFPTAALVAGVLGALLIGALLALRHARRPG